MHLSDVNLAGLATLAFLVLFLPSTGLIHRRARAIALRSLERDRQRDLDKLIVEEANRILADDKYKEAIR